MMIKPYVEIQSKGASLPIVISCPHAGTTIPSEILKDMDPQFHYSQPDADWLVHRLYEFATEMGINLIYGVFSRYVIDLNRDPKGAKLYNDGRTETELCPTKTFAGQSIYLKNTPSADEIAQRVETYYLPYHQRVQKTLSDLQRTHKNVLLLEAHSIARSVPSIRKEPFPDLMLGDQDGKTALASLTEAAFKNLKTSPYKVSLNDPFKGGFITREFGKPASGQHALQLEIAQDLYLSKSIMLDAKKLETLRPILKNLLLELSDALKRIA